MNANFEVLVVGRASSMSGLDIEVPAAEATVGRRHAEITIDSSQRCHIVDLGSTNGTFVRDGRRWKRIKQASLRLDDPLRLGDFTTSVAHLMTLRRIRRAPVPTKPPLPEQGRPATPSAKPKGGPRRNPITGEVE
jgi:pSer/pThr/pTyr-binding forkhead associated (FHA) protein